MTNERIKKAFSDGGAFIGFLTGGDPNYETSLECAKSLAKAGTALIEIGLPFSDPTAEGPVIEAADVRALSAGINTESIFQMIKDLRDSGVDCAIVIMTYYNPVYVYGEECFLDRLVEVGGDGLIVPDMPYEESSKLRKLAKERDLNLVSLVAPTSNERIQKIAKDADGFLYVVSSLGTTGVRQKITTDIKGMIDEVRKVSDIPTAVGFGISTPEQAKKMCEDADGAIVGSKIVTIINEDTFNAPENVYSYAREMVKACKSRS